MPSQLHPRRFLALLLISLLCDQPLQASEVARSAATSCASLFKKFNRRTSSSAFEALSSFERLPPAWQELTDRGVLDRYWDDARVDEIAMQLATAPDARELMIVIDHFKIKFEVHRKGETLSILIPSIRVAGTELGGRVAGMDTGFVRLLAGVIKAVKIEIAESPKIKNITVEANKIVNADLIDMLQGLGFERFQKSQLVDLRIELQRKPPTPGP